MNSTFIGSIIFLILIIILGLFLAPIIKVEGFSGLYELTTPGTYPVSVDKPILNDFPLIGKNRVSNDSEPEIWWHYPVLPVGTYKQITNNIRYPNNPDIAKCTPTEFCGSLYHEIKNKSNIICPLPPAQEGPGARVGYFRTEPNELYFSIPTNENILY